MICRLFWCNQSWLCRSKVRHWESAYQRAASFEDDPCRVSMPYSLQEALQWQGLQAYRKVRWNYLLDSIQQSFALYSYCYRIILGFGCGWWDSLWSHLLPSLARIQGSSCSTRRHDHLFCSRREISFKGKLQNRMTSNLSLYWFKLWPIRLQAYGSRQSSHAIYQTRRNFETLHTALFCYVRHALHWSSRMDCRSAWRSSSRLEKLGQCFGTLAEKL